MTLDSAISRFGASATAKLSNVAASGEPEDQLRAPLEALILDLAELCGLSRSAVAAVGESSLSELKARPDYAVTVSNAQVGFIEVKAPGKGGDPRRFRNAHDKAQWAKLQYLPNLIYTDGNDFTLWHDGELAEFVKFDGDVATAGKDLKGPAKLLGLFESFLRWEPVAPRDAAELARVSARLCRFLREEVTEQLEIGSAALTGLAAGWRRMLFPEATDAQFADGYAQAVTFGLLVARAKDISLGGGLREAAIQLGETNSLIGAALRILTDEAENERALKTSIATLSRVLGAVHWQTISKGSQDTWLYFYEDFLEAYDNVLRKKTGSYYTPAEVVSSMVRLVDDVLRSPLRFKHPQGLASRDVTIADPAVGTGTFMLGVLRRIAEIAADLEGEGAVAGQVNQCLERLIGFEMQLGPFAVAQLRLFGEIVELTKKAPTSPLRMYVTDTLGNPYAEDEWLPNTYAPIAESRQTANEIKKKVPITVVIGNPPYKEKAKGMGGWVEKGGANTPAILNEWMPPASWGVGAHAKHLRNLYVYFWRWASWKVFDQDHEKNTGVVCFITVAGFLNGPGFEKMRDDLRRKADEIWVINCSPEGHQPEVNTRIFQDVQQPICIVLASRHKRDEKAPAAVRYRSLPAGLRTDKFTALNAIALDDPDWETCSSEWRASFLPDAKGAWADFPALDDFFIYNGSGVMPGRTWVIAPDPESLRRRWGALVNARQADQENLFHPHLNNGQVGDRHMNKTIREPLAGNEHRPISIANDKGGCVSPIRYSYRSFDRQWIIPDPRLINRPNPQLWNAYSAEQVYLTTLERVAPTSGPAFTFGAAIPDLDHYKGSFGGRVYPLWQDAGATISNVRPELLAHFETAYGETVSGEDVMAYLAAVASHPAFIHRYHEDLSQPGLRIPLTADGDLFREAAALGRRVIWLQTYGERFADPAAERPNTAPRLPKGKAPAIPLAGAIPSEPGTMPDSMEYDAAQRRLLIGSGFVENVSPQVWNYEISGKNVLRQWFSYRREHRERPTIGDRREPSRLGEIQPDHWLAEYTSDLIDLLNILTLIVDLEPSQAAILNRISSGPLIGRADLPAPAATPASRKPSKSDGQPSLDGFE